MGKIQETIEINRLFDVYGKLLTQSQQEIMIDYYEYNLSLSEISENREVSRSAVQDCLKKSVSKLEEYEKKMGFCRVFDEMRVKNPDVINKIEEKIKNGI